jgi:hypothetical protein
MRSIKTVALVILVWLAVGSTVLADVQLSIRDGRISIVAKDATVSQILAEWAKVGQTKIVNGEKIPRDPITIELENVSEERALDVVLRTASGYITASRAVAVPNASRFDRIIVMPPSVVPTPPPPGAAPTATRVSAPPPAAYASAPPAYQTPASQAPESPQQASPVVAPESAYDNANGVNGDQPSVTLVGGIATPIPMERAQVSNRARQALETVDPRTFKLPSQPQGGAAGVPRAGMPPSGVAVPGMIVQPKPKPQPP